ncbi:hypothetical protein [Bradyrhizobium liaoningense]|uniref:hypothetical protein n=1 Tax=Bradyrhizobium liaoningense TaxID=43992 RepID=UPI001BA5BDE1|nr:hypothetical protein [Bradyrhizobium liaoningense]MBR1033025.1 hypothetical protein [Bradyrhizobium liaoningense]
MPDFCDPDGSSCATPIIATRLSDVLRIEAAPRRGDAASRPLLSPQDIRVMLLAEQEFRRQRAARGYMKQCDQAFACIVKGYGAQPSIVIRPDRDPELIEMRQKMMAFVAVTTGATHRQVGLVFKRDHSSVGTACARFAAAVRATISSVQPTSEPDAETDA